MIPEKPKLSRANRICAVSAAALAVAAAEPRAVAQETSSQVSRSADCLPRASRARESCDPKQVVVRIEKEVDFSLEVPAPKAAQCVATIEIAYTQRDTSVGVEGTIANNVCAASGGEYKLLVSVRGGGGVQVLEFLESWLRQDDQPVHFSKVYPIGEDVDLLRVRPTQVRCTCADETD